MIDFSISYKSERRPPARHLQKVLMLYGFDAWYDYGLIPGEDFEERLMAELRASKVCLVLWCEMSSRSPWVIRETEAGTRRLIWISIESFIKPIFCNAPFTESRPIVLNRHWILHGRDTKAWGFDESLSAYSMP